MPAATTSDVLKRERLLRRLKGESSPRIRSSVGQPIRRASRDKPLLLSLSQLRLWLVEQMQSTDAAYHMFGGVRLTGALEVSCLRRALDRVVERHEILRTVFVSEQGEPYQQVRAASGFALREVDLSGLEAVACEAALKEQMRAESQERFDLSCGPLIRGRLMRVDVEQYVLLITMHHIISDGWSLSVLLKELSELYAAYCNSQEDPLPPLEIQYADYAQWQREWLQGEVLQEQLSYWKQHLSGAPPLLELPTDRARPAQQSFAGGAVRFGVGAQLSEQLRSCAQHHGVTLFMVLYAAWAVLLSRLSGQRDVVIGTSTAHRPHADAERLIGFFINNVPLRVQVDEELSVAELLRRVKQLTLSAYAHQDVPFEQIVEAVQPDRTLSYSPLFQVLLVLHNAPGGRLQMHGVELSPIPFSVDAARFDLTLFLTDTDQGISGNITFATALFDRSTIERWVGHLRGVLAGLVADGQRKLYELELLTEQERRTLLVEMNRTQVSYPQRLIHELFEEQVRKTPQAVAVRYEDRQLSYEALNARANQLARWLRDRGVGPDALVGVCLSRSLEMVIAVLGVLKAGGAYVPLDPSYPSERLQYMVEDARPRVLLTQKQLRVVALPPDVQCLELDAQWAESVAHYEQHDLNSAQLGFTARQLAYVIYTSGSTGHPKGVMVEHASVVNLWSALERAVYAAHPRCRRIAINASLSFDSAVKQLIQVLSGRELIIVPDVVRGDPVAFATLLERERIDCLDCTPSQLVALLDSSAFESRLHGVSVLLIGGEAIERSLWSRLARLQNTSAYNVYGPTECTVDSTIAAIDDRCASPNIGKPIDNVAVVILDHHGRLVPPGVAGEIHIGGAGVARGYLSRAAMTADRFVTRSPCQSTPMRLYRTGDMGRWLNDGSIEFLGRNDDQVKVRGFRIETREIEAQLVSHPSIRSAVVMLVDQPSADAQLVAYFVRAPGAASSIDELVGHLRQRLPEYMIPAAYVELEALPLSASGKLDRKALPQPDASAYALRGYEAPRAGIEEQLARIWCELLKVERVGRRDSFFALGGHSLLAIRLLARIRQGLGGEISIAQLFESPTIEGLASKLRDQGVGKRAERIRRRASGSRTALSLAQQRLWFIDQLQGESAAYRIAGAVRLIGALEVSCLRRALDRVVERHEILRTVFVSEQGEPYQQVRAASGFALREVDLSGLDPAACEAALTEQMRAESQERFDLSCGPLIRGRLLRVDVEQYVLLITMHHIISDGWSLSVLLKELSELYAAYCNSQEDPLPPLEIQYADYAQWQREWLQGEVLQEQLSYWKQHLSGAPPLLELPTDRVRPAQQSFAGGAVRFGLGAQLSEQLRSCAQHHGVTLFMVLYTAWAVLLSRLSGQRDVVIGVPVANRQRTEVEGLIGFFVNTLALRVQLEDELSVAQLLQRVKQVTLQGYAHQETPFEQVVEVVQPPRSLSHSPLFQAMLVLQNTPKGELRLPGVRLAPQELGGVLAQFDLTLSIRELPSDISVTVNYASALFDAPTIERWAGHLKIVLAGLVADGQRKLYELELLTEQERRTLLLEMNRTQVTYPRRLIHELFEEQVRKTPQAVAVRYEDRQLSYEALNARANQLARWLRDRGVGPDALVGVCLSRSLEMVIAVLGVLKAGGAYVPLDPSYPSERLQYMVEDARPRVLLTQKQLRVVALPPDVQCLELDAQWVESVAHYEQHDLNSAELGFTARQLAYVIYTSGSTGHPKGVMVEHASVVNLLCAMRQAPGIDADERFLALTTLSFDIAALEIYLPLMCGAELIVVPQEVAIDAWRLASVLGDASNALLQATPTTWRMLLGSGWPGSGSLRALSGGEPLGAELAQALRSQVKEVWNLYGPTETTIWSCSARLSDDVAISGIVPIGRPISNTHIYVLDERREPVPVGIAGEIYIGGAGVARGYLNREELTRERFVSDPFREEAGARMYRTGDLGRWRADGELEYLGRNDQQVKIRGFRIELGEIEARLMEHADIAEAVVVAREEAQGERRLVAYYTSRRPEVNAEQLRTHLKSTLPEYMVPAAYVELDSLPLTPNGKLDRKNLPAPDAGAVVSTQYEPPQGETEHALAVMWCELLHVERVGREDNFFELGGHSLLAVQLISRVNRSFQAEVALKALFEVPTLRGFSHELDERRFHVSDRSDQVPGRTRITI